jgi:hypothetical protein
MAAVVCELSTRGDADAMASLTRQLPLLAHAIIDGVRRGIEEPIDAQA